MVRFIFFQLEFLVLPPLLSCQQVFRQGRHAQFHRAGEGLFFLQAVFNRQENPKTLKPPAF